MGNSDDPAGMSGFKPGLLIKAYYPSYRWKFIRRGSPKTPKTHLYGSILSRGRKKNKEKGKVRFASCSDRPDMPSNRTDGTGCVPETAEKSSGSVPVNRLLSERDACRKPLKERDACRKPLKERDACRKPLKERDACRKPLKELSNEFQVPGGEDVYEFPDDPKDSPTSGICKVNYKNKKLQASGGKDPKSEKPRNTEWRTATNMCKISVKKTSRPSQKYSLSCGAQKRPNYCNESYSENNLFDISDDDDGDDAVFRVSQLYGSSIIHVGCSSEKKKKVHSKRKKRTSLNSLINKASQTHLKKVKMGVFKAGEERKFFRSKGKISVSNESKVNPITFTNEKDNLCKELHNTHEEITIQGEICISDDNSETTDYLNRSLDTRDRFSYAKSTLDTDTRMSVYDFYDFADSDPHPVHQEAQCSLKKKTRKVKGDTGPAAISLEENDDIKHDRNNAANVKPEDKDRLGENNDSLMVTSKARPYVAEHGPREYLYFNLEGQETEPGAEQISWPQNIMDEVMTSDTDSCTDIDSTGLLCPSDDEPCTPGPLFFDTKWAVSHGVRMLQHLAATADATINKDFKSSCETELSSMSETSGAEQLDQDVPCRSLESFEEQVTQGRPHNENHGLKAGAEIFKTGQSVEPQFQEKTGRLPKQGSPTVNSEAADQTAISYQGIQVGQPYQLKLSFKNTEYPKNGPKTQAAKPSSGILCEMFQEPSATERDGVLCSYRRMITSGTGQRSTCIDSLFQNDDIFL